MRTISIAILCLVISVQGIRAQVKKNIHAQEIKSQEIKPIAAETNQVVVLYENTGYSGQSKSLGIGQIKFDDNSGLNDKISSLKVGPGMVVMIYESGDNNGGYGTFADLMEDCPDLSVYNFNDKISYVEVFSSRKPDGMIWVRGKMVNGQYIAGHWEREKANGQNPNSNIAVVGPSIPARPDDPNDLSKAPMASQAEIDELNNILDNQYGVGVIGGENARPFYYHANQPNEVVYKYQKLIDASRLPSGFMDWAKGKLAGVPLVGGTISMIPYAGQEAIELVDGLKDWILGKESTTKLIDAWYPVSEFKRTVCGKAEKNASICSQDYLHTKLTIDKDVNIDIVPGNAFNWALTNRWLRPGEQTKVIEAEVKMKNIIAYDTKTNKSAESTTPHNPLMLQIVQYTDLCVYGPWMADILDIDAKVPIPFTDDNIDLGKLDINTNDEIHPVNQLWYKKGNEIQLIAIADGNGYFEKKSASEIEASGINHTMRFYIAFHIPATIRTNAVNNTSGTMEYEINGIGFDFTDNTDAITRTDEYALKYNGVPRIKVHDNSIIKIQKTHSVMFDKVRTRPDGSIQGYIIVETLPIVKKGGSINITVKRSDLSAAGINTGVVQPINH
jgi:hypothetical protein